MDSQKEKTKKMQLTMFSTGRGDTVRHFLKVLGPRRLKRRYTARRINKGNYES
jgi:hypothetical protein